jgi:predicted ATPase
MKLDRIEVSGFKSIRELKLDLRSLNVLIGANGSGKSNFIELFEVLNNVVAGNFQFYVAKKGGAESFLYYGQKTIEEIKIKLHYGPNAYCCTWVPAANDTLVFRKENIDYYKQGTSPPLGYFMSSAGHKESRLSENFESTHFNDWVVTLIGLALYR